jgi:hypothetical protein
MTTTAPQWTITKKDTNGKPLRIETKLGRSAFAVYMYNKKWCFFCDALQVFGCLEEISNGEQAIADAIVSVSQHLAQLSAELRTIPLTIENQ